MMFDPEKITFFAKTDARGKQVKFGIKAKDRTRHVYVIGKTGMGKSTLLENMAVQDIQNGEGLAFIDPHGQTAETILEYVPEERKKDVLYFAPFDTANPIAFNVMEDVGPERRHLVVSGLMSVFKKIWVDAWSARMEYILQNTLMALLEFPNSTLLGVNRMLSDKHYRNKVIANIKDPAVKSFWVDEFNNYSERYMQEAGDAIKNKIGQFTANPLIRNIIGQPKSSFDLRKIMDEKKILIMNLSKGLVGESNANLLGSMLTTRIYLAAMSRADLTPMQMKEMSNFYFYVDEFQSFANATFADILSEARKYKLNLTIAHQYIEQMEEEVKNAVFGNVGTIISFRVGPFDAEVLETIYSPQFLAPDIVNLGFAQIYLTLMIDGIGSRPFSAVTLPPIEPPAISYIEIVKNESREQFGAPRAEVEEQINAWHDEKHIPEKPARRPQQSGQPDNRNNNSNTPQKNQKPPYKKNNTPHNNERTQSSPARDAKERTAPPRPPREQTADDLRAALKKMTGGNEKQPEQKPVPREKTDKKTAPATSPKPRTRQKPAPNAPQKKETAGDLKSALAAAVKNTPAASAQQPKDSAQTRSEPKKEPISTPSQAPAQQQRTTLPEQKSNDGLDVKTIARMLGARRGDRTPFK